MELMVQRYLRTGGTLQSLEREYAIRARISETLGVVSLNYMQVVSPMQETLVQECRALILDRTDWSVVSRSFGKFFNHEEPWAHEIDWASARVQEKVDGSLVCFYHYRGQWQVATKSIPDASGMAGDTNRTFRQLIEQALEEMGCAFAEFTARLDPAVYYSFELTAPENRVIVSHRERRLTWLAAWDAATLEELEIEPLPDLGVPRIQELPMATLDDVLRAAARIGPFEAEGFVVRDRHFRRMKIKGAAYLQTDRVLSSIASPRRKVELALSEQSDDLIPWLPERERAEILQIQARIAGLRRAILWRFEMLKGAPSRREFAEQALRTPYPALLFSLCDGNDADEAIVRYGPEKLVELLGLSPEAARAK